MNEGDPCPACDSTAVRTLFRGTDRLYGTTDREFLIIECRDCRLIRLFPQPGPEELRTYYPATYWFEPTETFAARGEEKYRRFVLGDHVRFVARALEDAGEDGPVLDVGCGGGLFLKMLAERGHRIVGLDFSLDAAAIAWRQNQVPAVCATLTRAPLAEASCAGVTMFHVLEHLYEPAAYLAAAHRLLKPDGRLVIQVPNAACWQLLLFGERWNGLDVPRHLFDFKQKDIEGLLGSTGFEVLRVKHFSLRDNPAGLATTIAPGLDPMARRVRGVAETPNQRLAKDLAYLGLVVLATPFTLLEAACRAGSTIMIEARKKS